MCGRDGTFRREVEARGITGRDCAGAATRLALLHDDGLRASGV
jgi:hypothetical protein